MSALGNGCAGVDQGDGFDCYGVPVDPDDPRTRRLTGGEIADVERRLALLEPQFYTLEERAHIRAGTFGAEGLALYRAQTGDAQGLPTVTVTADEVGMLGAILLLGALFLWGAEPAKPRRRS